MTNPMFCKKVSCKKNQNAGTRSASAQNGFTLIEILVVLAIIVLLTSIILPVFMRARDMGRRAVCISNMKQLALAFQMYTEDNDGGLPGATDGIDGEGKEGGWVYFTTFGTPLDPAFFDVSRGTLYPYTKNAQIYICPTDGHGDAARNSYAYNGCLITRHPTIPGISSGKKESEFDNPASWLLLAEEDAWAISVDFTGLGNGGTNDGYLHLDLDYISKRHAGGSSVSFLDGHVKWQTHDAIASNHYKTGGQDLTTCP